MTVRKADLSKGYWNPKRKLGVTTHFFRDNSATITLSYSKAAVKYKAMYGVVLQIVALLSLKSAWLPQIFFLDAKSTC